MQEGFGFVRGPRTITRCTAKRRASFGWEIACIVDDMAVADYGGVLIEKFRKWLEERWGSGRMLVNNIAAKPIKCQPLTFCLGRSVRVDNDLGIVMVSGEQYIEDMYKRYMVGEAEAIVKTFKADVPCEEGIMKLSTTSDRQEREAASLTRSLVQSLACTEPPSSRTRSSFTLGGCSASPTIRATMCTSSRYRFSSIATQGQAVWCGVVTFER